MTIRPGDAASDCPNLSLAGPPQHFQPRNFLRPCLLLLLDEQPTYGYRLREQLVSLSLGQWEPGAIYRDLNTMEDEGMVFSCWERSVAGPRRRRYQITDAGRTMLVEMARELAATESAIARFMARYEGRADALLEGSSDRATDVIGSLVAAMPQAEPVSAADGGTRS